MKNIKKIEIKSQEAINTFENKNIKKKHKSTSTSGDVMVK